MQPPRGSVATPAARDAARRRQRRQAWTFTVILLIVVLTGVAAAGHWMRWWTFGDGGGSTLRPACPQQLTTAPSTVTVNVYNGTDRFGLARSVAAELRKRGFRIASIANDSSGQPIPGVAVVRHGPVSREAARTVSAQLTGQFTLEDDGRTTPSVDLVIGPGYRALRPWPEASKAIAPVPTPKGCVERAAGPDT